jgi:hypothetical protein
MPMPDMLNGVFDSNPDNQPASQTTAAETAF